MENAAKKLIIALDDLDFKAALEVTRLTKSYAKTFKVGLSLFTAYGPTIVKEIQNQGVDVFLDLKLHDIPMQVAKAVESAITLKPKFLTVHASGGRAMLVASKDAAKNSSTTILSVSVLTSLNENDYREVGFMSSIKDGVSNLSELAYSSGIANFVCSPHEISELKTRFSDCLLVCPGVRPKSVDVMDQSRVMTPGEAISAGADMLVVGRPITKAVDIAAAAYAVNHEIALAINMDS